MRLIDADALIANMEERKKIWLSQVEYNDAICLVNEAPTEEPKQGEWIDTGEAIGDDTEVKCSLCGEELYWLANFCPNCGARMTL